MKKYEALVKYLMESKQRKKVISSLSKTQLQVVTEIVFNVIQGVCHLSDNDINTLRRHRAAIRRLTVSKLTLKERRIRLQNISRVLPILLTSYMKYVA